MKSVGDTIMNVTLVCSECGSDDFELDQEFDEMADNGIIRCSKCGRVYTKAALIEANQSHIRESVNKAVDKTAEDFVFELEKILWENRS